MLFFCYVAGYKCTYDPLTNLPQILIGELERPMEMFFAWFYKSKWTCTEKV